MGNLRSPIEEEDKTRTIARKILEDAVNGNKIVKKELDDHVKELDDKRDSINYAVEVDFEGVLCEDSYKQTMIFKEIILQKSVEAAVIRGIAAIGICAAWLELIFLVGRYPFRGGDFSIMFYNIIKKLARYVIAMFLMIIGFAFAFMVVNYGHDQETFESPIKSSIMTLTMALGEFNFDDFYNTFKEDSTSRGFAMLLLVLLILFGTITMVNLFIAVIISDINQLREDVYTQNLIHMAQCSILVEVLLPTCILGVEDKVIVCMHELCPKGCKGTKLPQNMNQVFEQLKQIVEENRKIKNAETKRKEIIVQQVNVRAR